MHSLSSLALDGSGLCVVPVQAVWTLVPVHNTRDKFSHSPTAATRAACSRVLSTRAVCSGLFVGEAGLDLRATTA